MISKWQAQYLKTLIVSYSEAEADLYSSAVIGECVDADLAKIAKEAERKLDNYIAKLTETGK